MRVLVACEESQTVTKAFRARGHNAFSCDLLPASGGHPEWHLRADVRDVLARALPWDMLIAFPPCDHLAVSGARWFPEKVADGRQHAGIDLFLALAHADVPRVAIENPVGIMSTLWRKPDQIVQPWFFGDPYTKTTCLWLRNLPPLFATKVVGRGVIQVVKSGRRIPEWYSNAPHKTRKIVRSRTFPGLAAAMAEQWGKE